MAITFRKEKINNYIKRLTLRKNVIQVQILSIKQGEQEAFIRGQLTAIELILEELSVEFLKTE